MYSDFAGQALDQVLAQLEQSGQHPAVVRTASPLATPLDAHRRPYVIARRPDGSLVTAGFYDRDPGEGHD